LSAALLLEEKVPKADEVKSNKQKVLFSLLLEEKVPQADEVKSKAKYNLKAQKFPVNKAFLKDSVFPLFFTSPCPLLKELVYAHNLVGKN